MQHHTSLRFARTTCRRNVIRAGLISLVAMLAIPATAGDLAPPAGAIQPTDRVTINPQSITLPYTISEPGSYVLTGNIVAPPAYTGAGIVITSDDVTLDLNGFTLHGVPMAGDAIKADAAGFLHRVSIKNGNVSGGWAFGVNLTQAQECSLSDLRVDGCSSVGVFVGRYSTIDHCTSSNNSFQGFSAALGAVITGCIAHNNGASGITCELNSVVKDCVVFFNAEDGIQTLRYCVVENCSAQLNTGDGIDAKNSLVRGCTSGENNGLAINDNGGSCTLIENH